MKAGVMGLGRVVLTAIVIVSLASSRSGAAPKKAAAFQAATIPNLVAYWPFEETNTTGPAIDATGNGHDGTYMGSVTQSTLHSPVPT